MIFSNPVDLPLSFIVNDEKITLKDSRVKPCEIKSDGKKIVQDFLINDFSLKITAILDVHSDYNSSEWYFRFTNISDVFTPVISNILPCDIDLEKNKDVNPVVHYATGGMCSKSDFQPHNSGIGRNGELRLWAEGGRSSGVFLPFFNICLDNKGYMFAIGWSGNWQADMKSANADFSALNVKVGLKETNFYLYPKESVRTPKVVIMDYEGKQIDGQNKLRRYINTYHNHWKNRTGKDEMPLFTINWGDCPCDAHIDNINRMLDNNIDFDVYWIDAAWFGKKPVWMPCTGDWDTIKKDKYPEEFKPIADLLHKNNKKLLLWFEPERVCEGTDFERLGDWLIDLPKDKLYPRPWSIEPEEPRFPRDENLRNIFQVGDKLINFANPCAVDYYIEFFTNFIKKQGIDFYRHDANIATGAYFEAADTEKRIGITELKWVEGLYRFWDSLLENCPGLVIDNCSSGGRRMDIEMFDRSIILTRTDCVFSEDYKQNHSLGLNEWFSNHTCTEGARFRTDKAGDFEYILASNISNGMMLNLSFEIFFDDGDDESKYFIPESSYDYKAIREILAKYRVMQPFYKYDYYPLSRYSYEDDALVAYELYNPKEDKGLVVMIKRDNCPVTTAEYTLGGVNKNKEYKVDYVLGNYDLKIENGELKAKLGEKHSVCCAIFS